MTARTKIQPHNWVWHKSRGAGLLEIMLVIVIAMLILVFSIKQYQSMQKQERIKEVAQEAKMVLSAVKTYYQSNCANQLVRDGGGPAEEINNAKRKLTVSLSTPQTLAIDTLFPSASSNLINFFGYVTKGGQPASFKASISVTPFSNAYENKNRFGQTWLWHANASACIDNQTFFPGLTAGQLKNLFGASSATEAQNPQASCQGVELTWTSLPRYADKNYDSNLSLMKRNLEMYTKQYQYGYWMSQHLDDLGLDAGDLNYLCQL